MVNTNLETHETLNLTEYGYKLLYETWGPSLLRRLDVVLNGYEYWMKSDNETMRKHKTKLFRQQAALTMVISSAMYRFAPNGVVRRRVEKMRQRYKEVIGEPTPCMKVADRYTNFVATRWKKKDHFNPFNQYPKEEPFKRYIYDKQNTNGEIPYRTEYPQTKGLRTRFQMFREVARFKALAFALMSVKKLLFWKSDPELDDYLIEAVRHRTFYGF
jgi:hypothetical protein